MRVCDIPGVSLVYTCHNTQRLVIAKDRSSGRQFFGQSGQKPTPVEKGRIEYVPAEIRFLVYFGFFLKLSTRLMKSRMISLGTVTER